LIVIKIFILGRQQILPEILFSAGKTENFVFQRPVISLGTFRQQAFAFGAPAVEPDFQRVWIVFKS